jgi:predicted ABC-type transport system involved in lysophospholipase L1 biosynthesis ATPase subunit
MQLAIEAFEKVGLSHQLEHFPEQLSSGSANV